MVETKRILGAGLIAVVGYFAAMEFGLIGKENGEIVDPAIAKRDILGSATGQPGTVYNIPAQAAVTFPEPPRYDLRELIQPGLPTAPQPVATAPARAAAQRGYGTSFAIAESIEYGEEPTVKKEVYDPSLLYPKEASYQAGSDIRSALIASGGGISSAGVAMGESFKGLAGGLAGAGKKETTTQQAIAPGILRPEAVSGAGVSASKTFSGLFSDIAKVGTGWSRGIRGKPAPKKEPFTEAMRALGGRPSTELSATTTTTSKKTPTDASKAIAHAKRLRAGRGD